MSGSRTLSPHEEELVLAILPQFPARDRLFVVLGLNSGLRLRELTSITIGQVWDGAMPRAFLRVERRQLKFGCSTTRRRSVSSRTLPLNVSVRRAIGDYCGERMALGDPLGTEQFLFPSPKQGKGLCRMQVSRILQRVFTAAGIDLSSRLGSHSLRKTFCGKIWEASGHDIEVTRASLGHRHIATTQAYLPHGEAEAHRLILALDRCGDPLTAADSRSSPR